MTKHRPIFPPGVVRQAIFDSHGGQNSTLRQATRAQLGHPFMPTASIYVSADKREYVGQVWLHELSGDFPLPDTSDTDRSDSPPAVYTGYLAAENLLSGRRKFGTPVRIKWINGRYEVQGTDGPGGENYLDGSQEIATAAVQLAQFDYGLLQPTQPPSGYLQVSSAIYNVNGTLYKPVVLKTSDLIATYDSGLVSGEAVAVQIKINPTTSTLTYTAGTAFTDTSYDSVTGISDHDAVFANYPNTIGLNESHIGWAKVRHGAQALYIEDLLAGPEFLSKGQASAGDVIDTIVTSNGAVVVSNGSVVYSTGA